MKTPRETTLSAIWLGLSKRDGALLHEIFHQSGWRLFTVRDRRRALACMARHSIAVVIAENDLPGCNWKTVLADLHLLACPPQLIVASPHADDHLWAEALNVGAFDVLAQPLDREEVQRVVASALRHTADSRPHLTATASA